tara:strand:- start:181 stop:528 length:348 start_codon:yes stop_codon:yes gene_type:complete
MSAERINAAILLLKSKALETYGLIKQYSTNKPEAGDAEEIAKLALSLVQYEGAMLTLQQYRESLLTEDSDEQPSVTAPVVPEQAGRTIVPTAESSPTYKRSMEQQGSVRKGTKNE